MAELIYYCGTMDSGKSTLALQTAHNHQTRGRTGLIFTNKDRGGRGVITSRLGLKSDAIEVDPEMDLHKLVVDKLSQGERIDFIISDETQFFEAHHIEELAQVVDGLGIDVFAFGILTDFRTKLADRVLTLQVEALCWCGERATHNARVINGEMVTIGEQVVVGDTKSEDSVSYEVLCRRHHMRKVTSRAARAADNQPLPFKN